MNICFIFLYSSQAQTLNVCVIEEGKQTQVHPESTECRLRNVYSSFPFFTHQCVSTIYIFLLGDSQEEESKLNMFFLPTLGEWL